MKMRIVHVGLIEKQPYANLFAIIDNTVEERERTLGHTVEFNIPDDLKE